jgi:FkbM family methyltransferase
MDPITKATRWIQKYNIKNNRHKIGALLKPDKQYFRTWINGNCVWMRRNTTDILVFKKIFIDKEYDFPIKEPVSYVMDIGANVGISALYFAQKFPKATIIAVEPETSNFELLKKNTENYKNIIPVQGGIGNHSGTFKIKNSEGDNWNFMLEQTDTPGSSDGRMYSIGELMEQYSFPHVDFLKIDIEGGEAELFAKSTEWLNRVKRLSIELHDFILPASSNTFLASLNQCAPFSLTLYGENIFVEFNNINSVTSAS